MEANAITWYVQNINNEYVQKNVYYAGNYTQAETPLSVTVRIWNNRFGTKAVSDATNIRLHLYFSNLEDTALLPYLTVRTNSMEGQITIIENTATVIFPDMVTLSGQANNGDEKEWYQNYIDVTITLDVTDTSPRLKAHDKKELYIEIEAEEV